MSVRGSFSHSSSSSRLRKAYGAADPSGPGLRRVIVNAHRLEASRFWSCPAVKCLLSQRVPVRKPWKQAAPANNPARCHDPRCYPFAITVDSRTDQQTWQIVDGFREPPGNYTFWPDEI